MAALRSGKYTQGRGYLYRAEDDKHCCLGVLCAISPYKNNYMRMDGGTATLPTEVQKWANISSAVVYLPNGRYASLVNANDSGEQGFSEIADIIEKQWEEL